VLLEKGSAIPCKQMLPSLFGIWLSQAPSFANPGGCEEMMESEVIREISAAIGQEPLGVRHVSLMDRSFASSNTSWHIANTSAQGWLTLFDESGYFGFKSVFSGQLQIHSPHVSSDFHKPSVLELYAVVNCS